MPTATSTPPCAPQTPCLGGFDPTQPISFAPEVLDEDFAATLNDFAAKAAERGAKVCFRFAPMNKAALDGTDPGRFL